MDIARETGLVPELSKIKIGNIAAAGRCCVHDKEDIAMKKFLLIAAASLTLAATVPASAQVYFGAGPGGVGVGDPDYGWRHHYWRDSYAYDRDDCRVIRQRIIMPSGRVIYRTRQICD
jgi:hypothetical protein